MAGRRARLRAETIRDIKAAALVRLREDGDVSLRAVARDIGMSAPGLYRYYDSREDLLTALITDGYHDLADALEQAQGLPSSRPAEGLDGEANDTVTTGAGTKATGDLEDAVEVVRGDAGDDHGDQTAGLLAACTAYRRWSVDNPNVFGLLFGDPLPVYAAPAGGVTVTANRRVGRALLQPLVAGVVAGQLAVPAGYAAAADTPEMQAFEVELDEVVGQPVPTGLGPLALALWGRLHGLVSLEVFGQLHWVYPGGASTLFEADMAAILDELAA